MIKKFIALIISIVFVHLIYIGYIRPEANILIEMSRQIGQSAPRDIIVIVKDYEQEICFILMIWGCFLIFDSYRTILKNKYLFAVNLVEEENNENFNPERIIDKLDNELPRECSSSPLIQTLRMALWRYAGTRNVQDLSDAVESNMEALAIQQDSENSMIRYLIWAIPSIGFIGTVRGIGQALSPMLPYYSLQHLKDFEHFLSLHNAIMPFLKSG
jgi:hypothetical protein